jgi:hypothetical protein
MSSSLHSVTIGSAMLPPPRDKAEQIYYHLTPGTSSSRPPPDILVDGTISYMFGPGVAKVYFRYLLKESIRRSLLCWDVPNWPGACFTSQGVLSAVAEISSTCHELDPKARLLDHDARNLEGTVVPQALWSPQSRGAMNKYVLDAALQFPIFFVRQDRTVGLSLHETADGPRGALLGAQSYAPLAGQSTLHVRIQVRDYLYDSCPYSLFDQNVALSLTGKGMARLFADDICGAS